MRTIRLIVVLLFASLVAVAQTKPAPTPMPKAPVSFDKAAMDTSVNPCQDFYQYACGGWRAAHPIPPDQSRYGRFNELLD